MAFSYSPKIVTDGLVLYLDAANPYSYVSGSTVWNDLSRSQTSGSLINGPTFSSANGGSIVFDGVDDYVNGIGSISDFSFIQNTGVFTVSSWIKLTNLSGARYFLGNNGGTSSQKGFYLGYTGTSGRLWLYMTRGSGFVIVSCIRDNFFTDNNWVFVTCVGDGVNCQFYKNGQLFDSNQALSTFSTGDSSQTLAVGRINNLNSSYWQGNVSQTSIYNRALSATEVLQNYNATKTRFGL